MKPLEQLAEDSKTGDLVRIFLPEDSDYVGYRWNDVEEYIIFCGVNPLGRGRGRPIHFAYVDVANNELCFRSERNPLKPINSDPTPAMGYEIVELAAETQRTESHTV